LVLIKNRDNNIHDVAPLFPPFLSPPPKAAASPSFFSSIKEEKNVIVLKEATAFVTHPEKNDEKKKKIRATKPFCQLFLSPADILPRSLVGAPPTNSKK